MSHARSSLDALLDLVRELRIEYNDGREPLHFDILQPGSLQRLSSALDIDMAAHAAELRRAKAEALVDAADDIPGVYLRGDSPSAWLHRRAQSEAAGDV